MTRASLIVACLVVIPLASSMAGAAPNDSGDSDGWAVYRENCMRCHGPHGEGSGVVPPLKGTKRDRANLLAIIIKGVPSTTMAGWDGRLSASDLDKVVGFILKEWAAR